MGVDFAFRSPRGAVHVLEKNDEDKIPKNVQVLDEEDQAAGQLVLPMARHGLRYEVETSQLVIFFTFVNMGLGVEETTKLRKDMNGWWPNSSACVSARNP